LRRGVRPNVPAGKKLAVLGRAMPLNFTKCRYLSVCARPAVQFSRSAIRSGALSDLRSVNSPASFVWESPTFIWESNRFSAIFMERGTVRVKDRLRRSNRLRSPHGLPRPSAKSFQTASASDPRLFSLSRYRVPQRSGWLTVPIFESPREMTGIREPARESHFDERHARFLQ
jgi:hypothetical protein